MMNEYINNKPYCTIQDVQSISGECRSTILRRIAVGTLKAFKRPNSDRWVIKQEDLINYLESRGD